MTTSNESSRTLRMGVCGLLGLAAIFLVAFTESHAATIYYWQRGAIGHYADRLWCEDTSCDCTEPAYNNGFGGRLYCGGSILFDGGQDIDGDFYIEDGYFEMNGGNLNGGLVLHGGTFMHYGGNITPNCSGGCAIEIRNQAKFIQTNGSIELNACDTTVNGGEFRLEGGNLHGYALYIGSIAEGHSHFVGGDATVNVDYLILGDTLELAESAKVTAGTFNLRQWNSDVSKPGTLKIASDGVEFKAGTVGLGSVVYDYQHTSPHYEAVPGTTIQVTENLQIENLIEGGGIENTNFLFVTGSSTSHEVDTSMAVWIGKITDKGCTEDGFVNNDAIGRISVGDAANPGQTVTIKSLVYVYELYIGPNGKVIVPAGQKLRYGRVIVSSGGSLVVESGGDACQSDVPVRSVTSGSTPYAEKTNDPIQTGSGEFFVEPLVDMDLGGPLPLVFKRTYAARLFEEDAVSSSLGPNWMHNYDFRIVNHASNSLEIVYEEGKIIGFQKSSDAWTLTEPLEVVYQLRESEAGNFRMMDPIRGQVLTFDGSTGKLTEIRDRNGNALTLTYDVDGNLITVADGLGRTLSFSYDGSGMLVSLSDGVRIVAYSYANGVLVQVTDAMGNATSYTYDETKAAAGPLMTACVRPQGPSYTQSYDTDARVLQQTDALGNTYSFQYDTPSAGTTSIQDPLGNTRQTTHRSRKVKTVLKDVEGNSSTYTYDGADRPSSVTDRLGKTVSFSFHSESGRLASTTDAKGAKTSFSYTASEQTIDSADGAESSTFTFYDLSRIDRPDSTFELFTCDGRGNVLQRQNQTGKKWTYAYNGAGQVLTVKNPAGGVTTYTYNADGTPATKQDSDTGTTAYGYDALRRLASVTTPEGAIHRMAYDNNDRLISATDENDHVQTFAYDGNGNPTSVTDPVGNTATRSYDLLDRVTAMTDRLGKTVRYTYDVMGHLHSVANPNGLKMTFGYDPRGWLNGVTLGGQTWKSAHDDEGDVLSRTKPLGGTVNYKVDDNGRVTGVTNALGKTTTLQLDSMGRITRITDPLSRKTQFTYDKAGNLAGITVPVIGSFAYSRNNMGLLSRILDPRGFKWTFGYTSMGRVMTFTNPLKKKWQYSYDTNGRLSETTFPDGTSLAIDRDPVGNVTREKYSVGPDLKYGYDALDQIVKANGIALTRDAEGRITNTDHSGTAFGATYDDAGALKSVSYANGAFSVTYTYSAATGSLSRVSDNLTGAWVAFTYDKDRRPVRMTRSNGVKTSLTWDAAGRPTRMSDGNIIDLRYSLDAAGQVVGTNFKAPLDPAKNLASSSQKLTYNGASQVSTAKYKYDGQGRMTASPGNAYAWDGASRLIKVDSVGLSYNGLGDLIRRKAGKTATRYYTNRAVGLAPIVAEKDERTGRFVRYYVWTPEGCLLYMIDTTKGKKPFFYHFDRTGSTLALTDASGKVTDSYAYDPYGRLLAKKGTSPQPFTFVGQWGVRREAAGKTLYHMGSRYYDAGTGRFLSRDPVWPDLVDARQINPYQYADQTPVNLIDPKGEAIPAFYFLITGLASVSYGLTMAIGDVISTRESDRQIAMLYREADREKKALNELVRQQKKYSQAVQKRKNVQDAQKKKRQESRKIELTRHESPAKTLEQIGKAAGAKSASENLESRFREFYMKDDAEIPGAADEVKKEGSAGGLLDQFREFYLMD